VVWVKICSQFHLNLHFGFSESLDNIRFTDEEHFERDLPLSQEIRFLLIFFYYLFRIVILYVVSSFMDGQVFNFVLPHLPFAVKQSNEFVRPSNRRYIANFKDLARSETYII